MRFLSVKTYNYRNLKNQEIQLNDKNILLFGENAQGKTNFLEAVYLLCFGSSFRTKKETVLIRHGEEEMALFGRYGNSNEPESTVSLGVTKKGKVIHNNGKQIRDRKELLQNIPCIVFAHDDIEFVKGSPDKQRWFFNQTISLYDSLYIDELRKYGKIVKQRNSILKEKKYTLLETYDIQMAQAGIELQEKRKRIIQLFNTVFSSLFTPISGIENTMDIVYRPSWRECTNVDEIVRFLYEKRGREKEREISCYGPHRDRFVYTLGGTDFPSFASTGQMRLVSLILRIAQCKFFIEKTGKNPILLIDDVLLELDTLKRDRLLDHMPPYSQAFYTFLPKEKNLPIDGEKIKVFSVENGVLREKEWKKREIF